MPQHLVSEQQVKNALNIDSFRNLSKEKIMEFVSLIPNMDKEVAVSIISQFPSYSEMAKFMIVELGKSCDKALIENETSQNAVFDAYKKILDDLGEVLKRDNITPEERAEITNQMVEIADKMAVKDSENKNFISWIVKNKNFAVGVTLLLACTILGVNIKGHSIPKLSH